MKTMHAEKMEAVTHEESTIYGKRKKVAVNEYCIMMTRYSLNLKVGAAASTKRSKLRSEQLEQLTTST